MENKKPLFPLCGTATTGSGIGQGSEAQQLQAQVTNKAGDRGGGGNPGDTSAKPPKSGKKGNSESLGKGVTSGSSMAAACSSGSSKKRQSSFEVSGMDLMEDEPVDEEEDLLSGQHVNHLLTQLGSQIQNRVRAKKQKLDKCFLGWYSVIEYIKNLKYSFTSGIYRVTFSVQSIHNR